MAKKRKPISRKRVSIRSKDDERHVAHLLNDWGYTATRTAQHCGDTGIGDVQIEEAPGLLIEVKGGDMHARLLDTPALLAEIVATADRQAKTDGGWCIFWRGPRQPWKMTLMWASVLGTYTGGESEAVFRRLVACQ